MTNIDELLTKIEARKVVFKPSKEDYVNYVFELGCREMEMYGLNPASHPASLISRMENYLSDELQAVDIDYTWGNGLNVLVVPSESEIDNYVSYKKYLNSKEEGF